MWDGILGYAEVSYRRQRFDAETSQMIQSSMHVDLSSRKQPPPLCSFSEMPFLYPDQWAPGAETWATLMCPPVQTAFVMNGVCTTSVC